MMQCISLGPFIQIAITITVNLDGDGGGILVLLAVSMPIQHQLGDLGVIVADHGPLERGLLDALHGARECVGD